MDDEKNRNKTKALDRYKVISAYIALDLPQGKRGDLLEELAPKKWLDDDGNPIKVEAETIRKWIYLLTLLRHAELETFRLSKKH